MPDRQSNYRQARLSIYPPESGTDVTWSLTAITVSNGVPHSQLVAHGSLETAHDLNTADGVWAAFQDLAELHRR